MSDKFFTKAPYTSTYNDFCRKIFSRKLFSLKIFFAENILQCLVFIVCMEK
jgi:hypothetical protein